MPRFRETIPVDDYVLDILMRDVVGHVRQPAAYLVYLYLYGQAARAMETGRGDFAQPRRLGRACASLAWWRW